nr:hypothetical protein HAGR004_41580 [Bdellovibrio sp. HAGR004]
MHWSNMGVKFWELPSIPLIRDFPMALKLLRPIVKSQNKFRIEDQLKSSSELICVSIPDSTQSSLNKSTIVKAGGLMMELWLSLNKMGFGVQPLTIVSTFAFSIKHGLSPASTKWKHFFETGEALLKNEFSIATNNTPIWIVRTGKSPGLSISMRTLRMAPILKIIE